MCKKKLAPRAALSHTVATPLVSLVGFLLATLLLFPAQGLASFSNLSTASLPGDQPTIRILTLNVMQFTAKETRNSRFSSIANYLNDSPPVHALALQELSGGTFDGTDTGVELASQLGGQYGYYTKSSHRYEYEYFGITWAWTEFKVGVMSRYPMEYVDSSKLGPLNDIDSVDLNTLANVVMCVMDIPGFGLVNLYSTHFYTGPSTEIQSQANELMTFVNGMDQAHPSRATIVAGDMNFTLSTATQGIYDTFFTNGFIDSYPEANTDPGYTFAVAGNPFAPDNPGSPRRIDYIFVRGDDLKISSSQVVFDGINGEYVSDHFGVVTEITATPLPSSLFLLGSSLLGLAGLGYRRRRKGT